MKSVTEFANFSLKAGLTKKAALLAEGKSAEEIEAGLGEAFKLEGEKLKYFANAMEVATQNADNLKRVLVVKLNEGENAPAKATLIEELHYVPEFHVEAGRATHKIEAKGKGGRGDKKGGRGPKESPWGLSPEEKAAKLAKSKAAGGGPKPKA